MLLLLLAAGGAPREIVEARDRQDRAALEKLAADLLAVSQREPQNAPAAYRAALAFSHLAEVALELRDNAAARRAAEQGLSAVDRALAEKPGVAEYHRLRGTLCGQAIPGNLVAALRFGRCAQEALDKALQLDPKFALGYLSRGVGNFYLPAALGGGPEAAIRDLEKALALDAASGDAWLWLGLAQRKVGRNAEARKSLQKATQLNPARVWAKQQLDRTPRQ